MTARRISNVYISILFMVLVLIQYYYYNRL